MTLRESNRLFVPTMFMQSATKLCDRRDWKRSRSGAQQPDRKMKGGPSRTYLLWVFSRNGWRERMHYEDFCGNGQKIRTWSQYRRLLQAALIWFQTRHMLENTTHKAYPSRGLTPCHLLLRLSQTNTGWSYRNLYLKEIVWSKSMQFIQYSSPPISIGGDVYSHGEYLTEPLVLHCIFYRPQTIIDNNKRMDEWSYCWLNRTGNFTWRR